MGETMARLLIIGAGGVSTVVVDKCAKQDELFQEILLASRTESKCKALADKYDRDIQTAGVDADNVSSSSDLDAFVAMSVDFSSPTVVTK